MSSLSLPRLIKNGGGYSNNPTVNHKYMSLNNRNTSPHSKMDYEILRKRRSLNRNGTISKNCFRGVRKDMLERQTTLICHSMTVSILYTYIKNNNPLVLV